jgi:hypothetical protein
MIAAYVFFGLLALPLALGLIGSFVKKWWLAGLFVPVLPAFAWYSMPECKPGEYLCSLGLGGFLWLCFMGFLIYGIGAVVGHLMKNLVKRSRSVFESKND